MMKTQILSLLFFFTIFFVKAYELTIVAKVNNEIITNIDLENRLKMAIDLSNLPDETKIRERLKPRVLDSLINETLKIQEANRLGIFITNQEVTGQINRLEKRLRLEKNSLLLNYQKINIPEITILNQIRSQLLWEKLVFNVIIKNISVSEKQITETFDLLDEEIKNSVSNLNIGEISSPVKTSSGYFIILLNDKRKTKKIEKDQTIYDLSQILFKLDSPINTNQEKYYKDFLSSLKSTIRGCADLEKLIDEIPEGFGGNLGKIDSKNIERQFFNALQGLPVGVLSEAVTTEDGVHRLMICTPVTNNTYAQLKKSVEANIRKNKIDIAAQSLLNRIKRKALIEINNL